MFQYFQPEEVTALIAHRDGEVKLGNLLTLASNDMVLQSYHKFALLGIPEETGVIANKGIGGTTTAWKAFLSSFLNIQANSYTPVDAFVLWGTVSHFDHVEEYDTVVAATVRTILQHGLTPIVIGGGHNNAYPLLQALSQYHNQGVNTVNIDPHADLRRTDERHSGNGFSCAIRDHYLEKYALLGLHQSYNNQYILDQLSNTKQFFPIWWEDVFLDGKYTWQQAIEASATFVAEKPFGVDLDLDSIEHTLSSALTPVGISTQQACSALYYLGQQHHSSYLHLPEGIAVRADGLQQTTIGKLLSYLVMAFVKGKMKR